MLERNYKDKREKQFTQAQNDSLAKMVLGGDKPGAYLVDNGTDTTKYEQGLDVKRAYNIFSLTKATIIIGKPIPVSEVLEIKGTPKIPEISYEITSLLDYYKHTSVADTLVQFVESPKKTEANSLPIFPDIAAAEGILLGYENCCIEYYVHTRYFDKPKDKIIEARLSTINSSAEDPHILCPDCINA